MGPLEHHQLDLVTVVASILEIPNKCKLSVELDATTAFGLAMATQAGGTILTPLVPQEEALLFGAKSVEPVLTGFALVPTNKLN